MTGPDYGALLETLRGVTWPARRAALAGTAGMHRSRLRGLSAEFTEYRPYRQGDDPRRLDWKLLARTDRAYLRLTSDRATLGTVLLVDASASMAFPAGSLGKWQQACRLVVGLAAVALAAGDPVGIALPVPGGTKRVQPRTRRGVLGEIVRALAGTRPGGITSLGPTLAEVRGAPRVAIVTDFLGDEAAMLRGVGELIAGGTEVHAVHVVARSELEPAGVAILATDPERADLRRPLVAGTREAYRQRFAEWRRDTARAWRSAGASWTEVADDDPASRAVRRIAAVAHAEVGVRA